MSGLKTIQAVLSYRFQNAGLLGEALTHCSYSPDAAKTGREGKNNERLEFLGDSILSMVVSEALFIQKPDLSEGEMSFIRSCLIREETLAEVSAQLEIGRFLKFGKGEERSGGRNRQSILADAF